METDRKIDKNTPNLLVKYRSVVKGAVEKGVREALAKHKASGNTVAVSRNGKVVLLNSDDIGSPKSSLDAIFAMKKMVFMQN